MMNSHHNETGRKNVPVRKASNESTDVEEEVIEEPEEFVLILGARKRDAYCLTKSLNRTDLNKIVVHMGQVSPTVCHTHTHRNTLILATMADTDKYSEYDFDEYNTRAGRKGRSKTETALERKSHAVEGHKLAGKIKITKTMMNSHHNEAGRKNVPVRKASNESTDIEEEVIEEPEEVVETKSELDIDNI
eukprot:sb/3471131/